MKRELLGRLTRHLAPPTRLAPPAHSARFASPARFAHTKRLATLLLAAVATTGVWAYEVGDTVVWSNADGLTSSDVTEGQHCQFAMTLPAKDGLPDGSVVRITKVKLASVNTTRQSSSSVNKNDPHSIAIDAKRSSEVVFSDTDLIAGKCSDTYSFTENCDVTVGKIYPGSNIKEYTNGPGTGITLLHSNGNTWMGSGTYNCTIGCTTSGLLSSRTTPTLYPVYEITATVVSIPSLPIAYEYDVAAGTVVAYSDKWATSIDNSYSAYQRLNSTGTTYIYDLKDGAGYANMPAKDAAFSFALYADFYRMSSTAKGVIAIFGNNGSVNKLILYREGANIKLGFYDANYSLISGTVEASVTAPTDAAFHLVTATCNPTTGKLSLYVDDGKATGGSNTVTPDSAVSVTLGDKFQLGSVHGGGLGNSFGYGEGCAVERLLGYDVELSSTQVATLATEYPSVSSETITTDLDYSGNKTLLMYSMAPVQGQNKFIGVSHGTLTIPEGSTISVPHMRVLNQNNTGHRATVNIAGTLNITSTSSAKNVWSERASYKGILWGHYHGQGTYNITGSLLGENAYLETVYTAEAQQINVNGGHLKVKALYANSNNSTIDLYGGGTLEVSEIPSDGNAITKNFRYGTFKVNGDATETRAINFSAADGNYTTLDPVANTLTLNAAAVTGTGDINVAPSGAGKVVFASLTDNYTGDILVSSGSAEIQGASGYAGNIEANAPLTIATGASDFTLDSAISGSGQITKTGTGTLTITGSGTSSGNVLISGGKVVLSGNEAKFGTGYFDIKPGDGNSATLEIAPGLNNTITLAPSYIVNSTDGTPYLVIGAGTVNIASTGSSDNGHFGSCATTIKDGGNLVLTKSGLLGKDVSYGITVENGGKLSVAAYQKLARNITLNGGSIDLYGTTTPLEIWGSRTITATANSSINAVATETYPNPNIWVNTGPFNLAVTEANATLTLNAPIVDGNASASQGKTVNKSGAGTLKLTKANTTTGPLNVNAGKVEFDGGSWASGTVSIASGASVQSETALAVAATLTLADGATIVRTSAGALTATNLSAIPSGTVNVEFADGVTPTDGMIVLSGTWATQPDAARFSGAPAGYEFAVTSDSLKLVVTKRTVEVGGTSIDVPETWLSTALMTSYTTYGSVLGNSAASAFLTKYYDSITQTIDSSYLTDNGLNGMPRAVSYLLGLENPDDATTAFVVTASSASLGEGNTTVLTFTGKTYNTDLAKVIYSLYGGDSPDSMSAVANATVEDNVVTVTLPAEATQKYYRLVMTVTPK